MTDLATINHIPGISVIQAVIHSCKAVYHCNRVHTSLNTVKKRLEPFMWWIHRKMLELPAGCHGKIRNSSSLACYCLFRRYHHTVRVDAIPRLVSLTQKRPPIREGQAVEKLQFFDKYARRHEWLWAKEF